MSDNNNMSDNNAADDDTSDDTTEEESRIVILIPDDPIAFNGLNTDTGYEQALGELVMLSLTEVDDLGNIFPV